MLTAQGKRRKSRLQRLFDNMTNALAATHSENKFTLLITAAVIGGCVGVLFGALFNNLLVSVILIAASLVVPYVYVKLLLSNYKSISPRNLKPRFPSLPLTTSPTVILHTLFSSR